MSSTSRRMIHNILYDTPNLVSSEELASNDRSNSMLNNSQMGVNKKNLGKLHIEQAINDHDDNTSLGFDMDSPTKSLIISNWDSLENNDKIQEGNSIGVVNGHKNMAVSDLDSNLDSNQIDELTPLLNHSSNNVANDSAIQLDPEPTKNIFYLSQLKKYIIGNLILLFLLLFIIFILVDLNSITQAAVYFDLKSISILDLTDGGINAHIAGTVNIDYNKIDNFFYRSIAKISSIVLSSVYINSKGVKLLLGVSGIHEPLPISTIFPPGFQVDLHQGSLTELDFITKTDIVEKNIVKVLEWIDNPNLDIVELEVTAVSDVSIDGKIIHFKMNGALLKSKYKFNKNALDIPIEFNGFEVNCNGSIIEVHAELEIPTHYPFNFTLDPLSWDFSVNGCDEKLISIGNWKSNEIYFIPNSPIKFEVNGFIDKIPFELLEKCDNSEYNALNSILNYVFENHSIPALINVAEILSKSLPNWLFYILHEKSLQLNLPIPPQEIIFESYNISTLEFDIPHVSSEIFKIGLNSNLSIVADIPIVIPFSIPMAELNFSLFDKISNQVISGRTIDFSGIQVYDNNHFVDINLETGDIEIQIIDSLELGDIINMFLRDEYNSSLYMDIDLNQVQLVSSLFSTNFCNLKIKEVEMKPSWFFPFLDPNDFLDVSKLDIIVQEMLFISSTSRSVELLIDVTIVNPLKYSIDIPEEIIKVYVNRNNSHFSNVQVSGLFIPAENSANITVGMNIFADTFDDKLIINDLISKYISGFSDLTVDFSRIEAKQNKNLNDLLKQISILQVKIPNLQFDHKGIGIDTHILSRGTNPSPFLLSAVIHILTSELEVVIYNPISNSELLVDLYHAEAKYEKHLLGSLARREQLLITPGIYHTPRLPIKLESGIGMDILRKAMNGKIEVNATALFNVKLDSFEAELMYHGSNLKSDVRL